MYLYTPTEGKSLVIERYTISGSGMQFDELIECLDAHVGKLLKREGTEVLVVPPTEPQPTEIEITPMPQTTK